MKIDNFLIYFNIKLSIFNYQFNINLIKLIFYKLVFYNFIRFIHRNTIFLFKRVSTERKAIL